MRKGFNGLSALAEKALSQDPNCASARVCSASGLRRAGSCCLPRRTGIQAGAFSGWQIGGLRLCENWIVFGIAFQFEIYYQKLNLDGSHTS